jgi:hypothetical protein
MAFRRVKQALSRDGVVVGVVVGVVGGVLSEERLAHRSLRGATLDEPFESLRKSRPACPADCSVPCYTRGRLLGPFQSKHPARLSGGSFGYSLGSTVQFTNHPIAVRSFVESFSLTCRE